MRHGPEPPSFVLHCVATPRRVHSEYEHTVKMRSNQRKPRQCSWSVVSTDRRRARNRYGGCSCTHAPNSSPRSIVPTSISVEERPLSEAKSAPVRDQDHVHRAPHPLEFVRIQRQCDSSLLHSNLSQPQSFRLWQGTSLDEVAERRTRVSVTRVAAAVTYPAGTRESHTQERWKWRKRRICEC